MIFNTLISIAFMDKKKCMTVIYSPNPIWSSEIFLIIVDSHINMFIFPAKNSYIYSSTFAQTPKSNE